MKTFAFVLLSAVMVMAMSCDVIDNPIENPDVPIDTTTKVKQNVLLEDYTGHTCGNCPDAADVAHQLETLYGSDRVIIVAVHAGPFATPQPPTYPTDFRTTVGNELDNTFKISRAGNPNGLVNRVTRNGKFIQSKDNWAPAVTAELAKTPTMGLKLDHTWNATTKAIDVTVTADYIAGGTEDYYVVVWLTESGIISDQTDYRYDPSHIEDYDFEHVLRASLNGTWGEQLSTTPVAAGQKITKQMSYTFPSGSTWNPSKCDLVAFVHRYGTEKNVVQVIKKKLAE